MNDQAQLLRKMINDRQQEKSSEKRSSMHVITVASGKGGVGKSNFSVNLALGLQKLGKRPIIVDADFGLANVEIILGESPKYNLSHLIKGQCELPQLITPSQYGISFISGSSGVREMSFLSSRQIDHIGDQLAALDEFTDILIIDTGAGINDIVMKFCNLAEQVYIVVTPEPTSVTDSYALIKNLVRNLKLQAELKLVINKTDSQKEAHEVFKKIEYASSRFLAYDEVQYAGFIPYDEMVFRAVKQQVPVLKYAPGAKSSSAYYQMAKLYLASIGEKSRKNEEKRTWVERFKQIFGT